MFGSGWLFRLALGLRLRRARRVRHRRARAVGDRGAAVGGPGVAAAVVVAGIGEDGGATDGAAAVAAHGDGGVVAESTASERQRVERRSRATHTTSHLLETSPAASPPGQIMFGSGWLFRLALGLRLRRARRVRHRRARVAGDRGSVFGGPGVAAAVVVAGVGVDGGAIDGPAAVAAHGDGGVVVESTASEMQRVERRARATHTTSLLLETSPATPPGQIMFGSGWLFRLALGLRLRRARRVRHRRARAAGDRGAAVGGPGVAAAVVVAGVGVDGGAIDGAAAVAVHGDGGVVAEGLGAAAVAVAGGVGAVVFHPLELICMKTIPKSEIEKNFEVPNAMCLLFEFRRTRQIRLCDHFNAFLIDVGWRRDGRAFFLMRRWRSFRLAKNVSEGSVLSFWTTGDANTFYVDVA